MQLKLSFSAVLTALLVALSTQDVDAAPLAKRGKGMVTLPLKRVQQTRSDIHPQVLLQQHINRGRRRLARMTGRAEPSTEELRRDLHKRVLAVEGPEGLAKRFNRQGIKQITPSDGVDLKAKVGAKGTAVTAGQAGKAGKAAAVGAAGAAAGVGAGKAIGAGTGAGTGAGKGTGAGTGAGAAAAGGAAAANATATGANNTSAGVSQADLDAIANPGVTNANAPTANNSLGLDIEANDVGYLATVQMGTPPQNFLLLMDSGSADLWVGGENCQSQAGGGCGNHNFLGAQSSSSFVETQTPFQVTYGTGEVAGNIVNDNINVAGLALNNHTFGVATTESVDFSSDSTPFDGLMGLAQSTLSQQKTLTPVESMAQQGLIQDAITSFKISRLADEKNDGEVTFGGLDPTKFDAQTLVTLPNVNTEGFWEGSMPAVTVNGQDTGLQGRTAILDTGTTLIVAPAADAAAVHQGIQGAASDGQGGFTVPCTTTASVALTFGGAQFAIDPRDLAFAPVDPNDPTGDCTSGISSGNIGGATEWLVGDVFLKNAYFSTDVTKNQISLAKLV